VRGQLASTWALYKLDLCFKQLNVDIAPLIYDKIWDAFRTDKQVICLCCIVCFNFDSLFVSWMRPYLDVNNGGCVCVVVGWRPVCMQT
jgi:hypothetical protein